MDNPIDLFIKFFPSEFKPFLNIEYLGSNYYVTVFEINKSFIFRFANVVESKKVIITTHCFLDKISTIIRDFDIPKPIILKEYPNFPFALIVFKKIPGVNLLPELISDDNINRLAEQIANFMYQLHTIDRSVFNNCSPTNYIPNENVLNLIKFNTRNFLIKFFSSADVNLFDLIWNELFTSFKEDDQFSTVVHGDFWYKNILVNHYENRIQGVLDFEDLSLGHPIIDFVSLRYYDNSFLNLVLTYYNKLNNIHQVACSKRKFIIYSFFRELKGLHNDLSIDSIDHDCIDKIKSNLYEYAKILQD